ncbi:MAG: hypothetical protein AAF705_15180, partial [Bacteroidota bacterium]
ATELLYTNGRLDAPALSILNIFSGAPGCKFKLVVGSAPAVGSNYMFDPNELILEAESNMIGRQQILGIFMPWRQEQSRFVLVNAGFGNMSVSSISQHADNARKALYYQFVSPISFKKLLEDAGAILVEDDAFDLDLRPAVLEKDTFIKLLN